MKFRKTEAGPYEVPPHKISDDPGGSSSVVWVQPTPPDLSTRKWRIALYSPGMVGLGHMRRNLLIAQTLANTSLKSVIFVIAEAREASAFPVPRGVDCLTLPALRKKGNGRPEPRYLDVSLKEVIELRARVIRSALESFDPDLLIVDHLPCGAFGELQPALDSLRSAGRTRFVLGLRDILEDPVTVQKEWLTEENLQAIRDYYSSIWIYGDASVYDLVHEYQLPADMARKVRYIGYLDQRIRLKLTERRCAEFLAELGLPAGKLILCVVGGGQDGSRLAEAFARAEFPPDSNGVIVTGPFMPPEVQRRLRNRAAKNPRFRVLELVNEPVMLLNCADRVIAMGGYNTVCEVLSFHKCALIVPRAKTRREQLIRAERLSARGLLDFLHPDNISPSALTEWLLAVPRTLDEVRDRIDFNGLKRLSALVEEVFRQPALQAASAKEGGGKV